jgi:hypothetical protein
MGTLVRVHADHYRHRCSLRRRGSRGPRSTCLIAARICAFASFEPDHGETRWQAPRSEAKPRKRPADGSGALPPGSLDGTRTPHRRGDTQSDGSEYEAPPGRVLSGAWFTDTWPLGGDLSRAPAATRALSAGIL